MLYNNFVVIFYNATADINLVIDVLAQEIFYHPHKEQQEKDNIQFSITGSGVEKVRALRKKAHSEENMKQMSTDSKLVSTYTVSLHA